jgi:hypothetical protein
VADVLRTPLSTTKVDYVLLMSLNHFLCDITTLLDARIKTSKFTLVKRPIFKECLIKIECLIKLWAE